MARILEEIGTDTICIKDMAGLLSPYVAYELVSRLKAECRAPIQLHTHYTSGMAMATVLKAIEAGVDIVDTAISSLAMVTSQPPTETLVRILQESPRDTGLDLNLLAEISSYFAEVRKKYAAFESGMSWGGRQRPAVPDPGWHALQPGISTARAGRRGPLRRGAGRGAARPPGAWATRRWSRPAARSSAPRRRSTWCWASATRSSRPRSRTMCGATTGDRPRRSIPRCRRR